jgi:hypothetical protein
MVKITLAIAKKVLETVDAGLVEGRGTPIPGKMCVEAAVAFAMGEKHTDMPKCVTVEIRDTKVSINDHEVFQRSPIFVEIRRAKMLRRLAIAQLGSKGVISGDKWKAEINAYASAKNKYANSERKHAIKDLKEALKAIENSKEIGINVAWEPYTFESYLADVSTEKQLAKICEDLVQILIKLKSPGTKYLYLTNKKQIKFIPKTKPKK